MTITETETPSSVEVALAYHARTKHRLKRYAAGPETLDWDLQPNPFREFEGCARTPLPLVASKLNTRFGDLYTPGSVDPVPLSAASMGMLLELSMGLSAWKEYGPDRWALRCNPSSGNLHPTEAYVIARNVTGLASGLHHYVSRDHALELRCASGAGGTDETPRLWIGLSSIHWREAWKYGERAFRYCQLDVGHAIGALRYAAGALGWRATVLDTLTTDELAALMGLDRDDDFVGAEHEEPDLLIAIDPRPETDARERLDREPDPWAAGESRWAGHANLLDAHPMYRWPVIDQVSEATHGRTSSCPEPSAAYPPLARRATENAAKLILGRRSAQRFDAKSVMSAEVFYRMLDSLLVRPIAPFDVWQQPPRLHPIVFVHRIEGIEPGLYVLPRRPKAEAELRASLDGSFLWQKLADAPAHLPLFKLLPADCRGFARAASCHQFIASDSCLALSMLSEFEELVRANPWHYRQLHWEAGLIGQALYLEAEAAGFRGTGIGCFFDDAVHELLGLKGLRFQSLYHFTVGRPLVDTRIMTLAPYPDHTVGTPKEQRS